MSGGAEMKVTPQTMAENNVVSVLSAARLEGGAQLSFP